MKRVLANIDADNGGLGCLRHGVLLVFGAPCQLRLLAGQEHGRTIPLADILLTWSVTRANLTPLDFGGGRRGGNATQLVV